MRERWTKPGMVLKTLGCMLGVWLGLGGVLAVPPALAVWPTALGGALADGVVDIATDADGNVYVVGFFAGTAMLGETGQIEVLAAKGENDIFVAKFDTLGNVQWVRSAGGAYDDRPTSIAVDAAQNVYIAGSYRIAATFGGTTLTVPPTALVSGFVAKLDRFGNWLWAQNASINAVVATVEPTGSGVFYSTRDADFLLPERSVGKLDKDGRKQWEFGTPNVMYKSAIAVGNSGKVFVIFVSLGTGYNFCGQTINQTGTYVAMLQDRVRTQPTDPPPSVTCTWVVRVAGDTSTSNFYDLVTDGENVYFSISGSGLVGRISPAGAIVWQNQFGVPGTSVAVDGSGNVYVTGIYIQAPSFAGTALPHANVTNIVVAKLLPNGQTWQWVTTADRRPHAPFTGADLISRGIAVDAAGRIYVAGVLSGQATFGNASLISQAFPDMNLQLQRSLRFDGVDDRVTVPGSASLDTLRTATVELWFNAAARGDGSLDFGDDKLLMPLVYKGDQESPTFEERTYAVWLRFDGSLFFTSANESAHDIAVLTPSNSIVAGQWYHFAGVIDRDAGQVSVYLNGVLVGTGTVEADSTSKSNPNSPLLFGATFETEPTHTPFKGELDEIRLWSVARNAEDIQRDLGRRLTGSEPGLVGYWQFNDLAETVTDTSAQANHGNLGLPEANDTGNWPQSARLPVGPSDGFVARLDAFGGSWFFAESWIIGQAVPQPEGALAVQPEIEVGEVSSAEAAAFFFWSAPERQLYAIRPVTATIKWKVTAAGTDTRRIERTGSSVFPPDPQIHVAGTPVLLNPVQQPADGPRRFFAVVYPVNGQNLVSDQSGAKVFQRPLPSDSPPQFTVLHYIKGTENNPQQFPSLFEVVRTVQWNDPQYLEDKPCTIGTKLAEPRHNDPSGKNGYVLFANAHYDGVGTDRAYDRETRTGPIIPVNVKRGAQGDDLVVVWYRTNANGVVWANLPVRYTCQWPANAQTMVIAGQQGSGALPNLPNMQIYHQDDPTQAGYNPNEEHAGIFPAAAGQGVFALRSDLNGLRNASEPYVLVKYWDQAKREWAFRVLRVVATDGNNRFVPTDTNGDGTADRYALEAGILIQPPYPLSTLPLCAEQTIVTPNPENPASPAWRDYQGNVWARAEGTVRLRFFYPLQDGFFYDLDDDGQQDAEVGTCVPLLDRLPNGTPGTPVQITYDIRWPADAPTLQVGETLSAAKRGLPDLLNQAAAEVIFDQSVPQPGYPQESLVRLIDPLSDRKVPLASVPSSIATDNEGGRLTFADLPFPLNVRLSYDTLTRSLAFAGYRDATAAGEGLLLPNIMSNRERLQIKCLIAAQPDTCSPDSVPPEVTSCRTAFCRAVDALYHTTRNPHRLSLDSDSTPDEAYLVGLDDADTDKTPEPQRLVGVPMALTAGAAVGEGFVTLAFNNDASVGAPVSLAIIKVGCPVYRGEIQVLPATNVFAETLTLRHSGDFGGNPDNLTFEWYYQPDTGQQPFAPSTNPPPAPWLHFAAGTGANEITLQGPGLLTLSDNWFVARYKGLPVCDNATTPSRYAGDPASTARTRAMLASGWIKRVVGGLNPFDTRVKDFHATPTASYASMVSQAGERYVGPIAFNPDPDFLNSVGLVQAYETVLHRGADLSINASIQNSAANAQLLNVATRIADLYVLLGNDAYADASDPTIGIGTDSELGSIASSIFAFQNQIDSPLEEELVLLRGRDDTQSGVGAHPVYNRLFWNFTQGDGEAAYVQAYRITDQEPDGDIDENDSRLLYPQGHGDAWGNYLTALKTYYRLLQHPEYTWEPRTESVLVAGVPIAVDFLDERKFARAAAAKARTGTETVNLTYRQHYVEDPSGQWQGYKDTNTQRAWGVDEWARRAGQGAYFDWLVANSLLPAVDPNPDHTGIRKIDRTTVFELHEITGQFAAVQAQMDRADVGLNPLGLAKGVVPFDLDPALVTDVFGFEPKTHFEQIYDRAIVALNNTVRVFNHANQQSQALHRSQTTADAVGTEIIEREQDYKHRLIEIFGYPYGGDIGPGQSYPSGYDGPDLYHYMYVSTDLTGDLPQPTASFSGFFTKIQTGGTEPPSHYFPTDIRGLVPASPNVKEFTYPVAPGAAWEFVAPLEWGQRRAPGELQQAISELLQAQAQLQRGLKEYNNLLREVEDAATLLRAQYNLQTNKISILTNKKTTIIGLNTGIAASKVVELNLKRAATLIRDVLEISETSLPTVTGLANDFFAPIRGVLRGASIATANTIEIAADVAEGAGLAMELAKEQVELETDITLETAEQNFEILQRVKELEQLWRQQALLRLELFTQREVVQQALANYQAKLAEGERLLEERHTFRILTAGDVQRNRYQDMTFRIFRNDALQKYRAQFDLAARYVYLAATAYDYETNLLGSASGAGRRFLTDIVRQRALGQVVDGEPVAGTPGLADVLARLRQNFDVYKGQLGFNNPQIETNRFSLRSELFRLRDTSDEEWRQELEKHRVANLWDLPEFRRYARPFAPEEAGPQPGLVIRFPSTVTFGMNFFGHALGGGDGAYDPTNFATKVRSVGIWFQDYNGTGLSRTPRLYLIPVGMDILRSPTGNTLATREWRIIDQSLPEPFPIGNAELINPDWIPQNDSLSDQYGGIRRFSSFRAFHDSGEFDESETTSDSRLIGRSVWNTDWLLIIPGGTLLADADRGLDVFIDEVSDIKIFFQTYGYSGN